MNLDEESNSEENFVCVCVWGGGGLEVGGGVGGEGFRPKKIGVRLLFVLMLYIKFQVPGSSGSLVLTQKRINRQVRGIILPMFYGNQSEVILTLILNNILNFRILAQAILYI